MISRRLLVAPVVAAVVLGGVIVTPADGAETAKDYYGDSARSVAEHIGCIHFRHTGRGELNQDGGICWVKGKRVNLLTFRGPGQQHTWNAAARALLPRSHWWANGKGALVTAKNGNKPAARIGARRLPGVLRHGS